MYLEVSPFCPKKKKEIIIVPIIKYYGLCERSERSILVLQEYVYQKRQIINLL